MWNTHGLLRKILCTCLIFHIWQVSSLILNRSPKVADCQRAMQSLLSESTGVNRPGRRSKISENLTIYLINQCNQISVSQISWDSPVFFGGQNRDIIPLYSIELAILSGLPTKHSLSKCCKAIAVLVVVASIMPFWWWYPIGFFLDRFLFDTETLEPCFFF